MSPSLAMRAVQVLDGVRPYLTSHNGDVELVSIDDGVACTTDSCDEVNDVVIHLLVCVEAGARETHLPGIQHDDLGRTCRRSLDVGNPDHRSVDSARRSILAAQMKSLSDRPSIACVV